MKFVNSIIRAVIATLLAIAGGFVFLGFLDKSGLLDLFGKGGGTFVGIVSAISVASVIGIAVLRIWPTEPQ